MWYFLASSFSLHSHLSPLTADLPQCGIISVNQIPLLSFHLFSTDNFPIAGFTSLLSHPLWVPGSDEGFPTIPQALWMPPELPPPPPPPLLWSCCPWLPCVCCPSSVSLDHPPPRLNMLLSSSCADAFPAPASASRRYWDWPLQQLYDSNPFDSKYLIEC